MKILLVDASQDDVKTLGEIVKAENSEFFSASNGSEAVDVFQEHKPELIFIDANLPEQSAFPLVADIKSLQDLEEFVPIIVLVPAGDSAMARKSVEAGADDFLFRPIDRDIIRSKISAMNRIRVLHYRNVVNHRELKKMNMATQRELDVSKHVFSVILEKDGQATLPIRSWVTPVSMFNGDLVLSARTPSGGTHVMLGDFTGHGLSAALGAIPTSDIFYTMTAKGFSIGDIAVEMNKRLRSLLPRDMFCAAILMEIDSERSTLGVWIGGMPDVIIFKQNEGVVKSIASFSPPLGVADPERFKRQVEILSIDENYGIYALSDGLINTMNQKGQRYQMAGLYELIGKHRTDKGVFDAIIDDVNRFSKGSQQKDDISLVEVLGSAQSQKDKASTHVKRVQSIPPASWKVQLEFDANVLKNVNPVPHMLNLIMQIQDPAGHRERIFTILSELFSNSLEHGLLELSSSLKRSSQGFAEYYTKKKERLAKLEYGIITVGLTHIAYETHGELEIHVTDSGKGFDYSKRQRDLESNKKLSGRGLGLINSMCQSLEYRGIGNEVLAVYSWQYMVEEE